MRTITLPGVAFPVSEFCLGTAYFGSRENEEVTFACLDYYYGQGGRFLNTAHEYGGGASERVLGKWMRERGVRHEMVVTSKCGEDRKRSNAKAMRREELFEDIDETLSRMGYDYVDFYLLHLDDEEVPVEEIITAMADIKRAGKIRHYGCSNWSVERMREADAVADRTGIERFVVNEIEANLAKLTTVNAESVIKWLDEEYIAYHGETQMAAGAYSPLAGGAFTKLIRDGNTDAWNEHLKKVYNLPCNFETARRIAAVSKVTGYTPAQVQIGFFCAQPYPFPAFPIVGARTLDQLKDTLAGTRCTLDRNIIDYLMMRSDML